MLKSAAAALSLGIWGTFCAAQDISSGQWIDLTHPFNAESIYWPTADKFTQTEVFAGQTDGGYYYSAYNFAAAEHGARIWTRQFISQRAG